MLLAGVRLERDEDGIKWLMVVEKKIDWRIREDDFYGYFRGFFCVSFMYRMHGFL